MILGPAVDPASGPDTAMSPDTGPGPSPGTVMVQGSPSGPDMTGHSTVMVRGTQSSYHCRITLYNYM